MRKFNTKPRSECFGIGGTDARRIVAGDWLPLYLEKVGETQAEDLSGVWPVQLGSWTEPLHLSWHERTEGVEIQRFDTAIIHPDVPHFFASLDGYIDSEDEPLEVKHTFAGQSIRDSALYYMPQLQHQMVVTGCRRSRFSIICGNQEPKWAHVDRDEDYITKMLPMLNQFWWHVENKEPPAAPEVDSLAAEAKAVRVQGLVSYDYATNNEWSSLEVDYVDNITAATTFEAAKKQLKELVPADAAEVVGKLVTIKRDARGALRFNV